MARSDSRRRPPRERPLSDVDSDEHQRGWNVWLRSQRRLRGWTLNDVAERLHRLAGEDEIGVDANMVSRWERRFRNPKPRYVRLLCRLFELPADELGLVGESSAWGTAGRRTDRPR
jgi:transcriptional regulator with XRE-family HTH domain